MDNENYDDEKIFTILDSDMEKVTILYQDEKVIQFLNSIPYTIEWIKNTLKDIETNQDKKEVLGLCIRKINTIYGFCKIFQISKLDHLFSILSFIFQEARNLGTLKKYSFDYLIKLLINKAEELCNEFIENKYSTENISGVIEECKLYCKPLFENKKENSEKIKNQIEYNLENLKSSFEKDSEPSNSITPEPIFELNTLMDEPEELIIPADKIGLISDFYEESFDNLVKFGNCLLELENEPQNTEILNSLFRFMHTIKGGARLLKIKKMELLSHTCEELLDSLRKGNIESSKELIDLMLDVKKRLSQIIDEVAGRGPIVSHVNDLIQKIHRFQKSKITITYDKLENLGETQELKEKPNPNNTLKKETNDSSIQFNTQTKKIIERMNPRGSEFIKVSTEKLDEVINYSSELSITRIQFENEFSSINKLVKDWKKVCERIQSQDLPAFYTKLDKANKEFIEEFNSYAKAKGEPPLDSKLINHLKKLQNELKLEIDGTELSLTEESILGLISLQEIRSSILRTLENLNLLTSRLQSGVMNFRMVPISTLFERFPTLIRDLAKECNKSVTVKIEGGETELDRTIINLLADPMIHLLRNSVDHGIENEEERKRKGKNPTGLIYLRAYYQGSYAIIEIRDDGRGIIKEKIIEKAVEKGILHYEDSFHLNEQEVYNLIFHAGFSTKDEVSELSGRGVGMDVVKSNIQSLQGEIEIKSNPNQGTSIYLRLPLTLAVVRVLLFEVSGYILAFPMANVYEILTINRDQLESIGSRILFHFNGAYIPVIKLSSILDIPGNTYNNQDLELILLEEGGRTLGIIVDKLIGRQEIVIKNLGSILQKVPFIMGCTILSDRRIVLILNSKEVIDEGFHVTERVSQQMLVGQHHIKQNILIVDDSSIHRQQLKTILVREGYHVDEAENGFEALKLVRLKSYKILCVDIVMPLMDGFELTKRMRSLPLYRSIPIFLITSSNSREDRDRGYKIGANEFFEKPINPELILEKVKYYIEKEGAK